MDFRRFQMDQQASTLLAGMDKGHKRSWVDRHKNNRDLVGENGN